MIELAVTVGAHGSRHRVEAQRCAETWGLPFLDRPEKGGVDALLASDVRVCLVRSGTGWALRDAHGSLAFGPGMAKVRLKRIAAGQQDEDVIVRLGQLKPGDTVIDATLGLAADALVCARAVGPSGRVVGVEASLPLCVLVSQGLEHLGAFPGSCGVEVVHGRARDVLARWPTGSADVVTLDPMFDRPKKASPTFDRLRIWALHEPLDEATLSEARRVARRWVVVKGGRYGGEFDRLGLEKVPLARCGPLVWARAGPLVSG